MGACTVHSWGGGAGKTLTRVPHRGRSPAWEAPSISQPQFPLLGMLLSKALLSGPSKGPGDARGTAGGQGHGRWGHPSASWGRGCPNIVPSGLGFLLLASLGGAPGSLALRTTGHGKERGDPRGPARRGRRRRTRRTVRSSWPCPAWPRCPPCRREKEAQEVSGFAEGQAASGGMSLCPGPRGCSPATARPAPSRPPWPLPSPPAPPGSKHHTQASGTGCSASSIPALFSFRGCPPKYSALWRQRQPHRPPGSTLESLGPTRVGASGAAKATAGWWEGVPGMSRWGRAGQPRTHQCGFAGWAEAGAAAPRRGARPQECGVAVLTLTFSCCLTPGARGDGGAGPGAWAGDTAGQRSRGWRGPGLPSSHPPAPILLGGPSPLRHLWQPSQDSPGKHVLLWAGWATGHCGAGGLQQRLEATPGGCRGGPSRPGLPGPATPSHPEASLGSGSEMIGVG